MINSCVNCGHRQKDWCKKLEERTQSRLHNICDEYVNIRDLQFAIATEDDITLISSIV